VSGHKKTQVQAGEDRYPSMLPPQESAGGEEPEHEALLAENRLLHAENRRLQALVQTDPLTGLLNRRGLTERLHGERSRLERGGGPLAAILVDLDDFKALNDAEGYAAGDRALVGVGRVTRETLRSSDILSRVGGDEFLLLLPQTGQPAATRVAERLRAGIEAIGITASIGVMELSGLSLELETILPQIQRALTDSKLSGKNHVTSISLKETTVDESRFEVLRRLLDRSPHAEWCRAHPSGGLPETLLVLDACSRQPGDLPLLVPVPPAVLVGQPALLDPFSRTRPWLLSLSTASLTDETLPLRSLLPSLRDAGIGLCLEGFTGSARGLEALILLRPEALIIHPRLLTSRTPGMLRRICAAAAELDCQLLADGISDEALLAEADSLGVIAGTGRLLRDGPA
jgi:diguanylate cyclase (GGDEF)-like protein